MYASEAVKWDMVKYLVECKAGLNARDKVTQYTHSNRLLVSSED